MTKHLKRKINAHVNVGTIGHIDHGYSLITTAVCSVLYKTPIAALKRELDLIDKNAAKQAKK
jgi:translation elongation factor EF-Tu-like GTPase